MKNIIKFIICIVCIIWNIPFYILTMIMDLWEYNTSFFDNFSDGISETLQKTFFHETIRNTEN
jgi:hypothetical protein